jgi:MoaA/NifB/PqqE/SkfB family radical SAM enzyme
MDKSQRLNSSKNWSKMFYNLPLDHIDIELTTRCNAACPMCFRNNHGDRPNPMLVEKDFELDLLEQIDVPVKKLALCGNYGDPIMHKELPQIIEYWFKNKSQNIVMMTNGGARSKQWWTDLGKLTKGKMRVTFGIDGLEDTNHLYRRNVRWDRLMQNTKAFIDAGGDARWKFIIFKHNEHQVLDARTLANKMGFKLFETVVTNRFANRYNSDKFPVFNKDSDLQYYLEAPSKKGTEVFHNEVKDYKAKNELRIKKTKKEWTGDISCYAKRQQSVYVAADGRVYPCPNTGYHFSRGQENVLWMQNKFYDLHVNTLDEIIRGAFFSKIENSWTSKDTCVHTCKQVCGIKRDNLNKVVEA